MVENLRKLRITNGITQQHLADAIGVTQQSINKYENHSVEPDICTLIRLADFFHTSVDYLVGHAVAADTESPSVPGLSREEYQFVLNYRQLSANEKSSIRLVIRNYLEARTDTE